MVKGFRPSGENATSPLAGRVDVAYLPDTVHRRL
jgi:hypothetical protein